MKKEVEDLFLVHCDENEHYFAESKETFTHEEEGLNFKYKYCIEADVCEGDTFYTLMIVPTPESLCEKKFNRVLETSGVEPEELNTYDVAMYGISIDFENVKTSGEEVKEDTIKELAKNLPLYESLFGFYCDKSINAIGWTGWSILRNAINGEVLK